ncbi:Holliday junction ATP-dependent DNA helicase RuvA [hydrothermal vent metagenome]|uniref:Holliday junction ATP-dependent DNA helicase RuvA n=1 Tax=hydrothermal vent metagenome TaxID=652676 RepID=A0A3B1BTM7_9ZZZZ
MIGYLTGKIISKKPTQVLLDVHGVGYVVNITISTFENLPDNNTEQVSLYTYLNVKEDAMTLFGFFTISEKEMFELLISVNGVGPKSAQSILSGIQIEDLRSALKTGDLSRIIAIPGIGRKTGQRLLIELRDKVESLGDNLPDISDASYSLRTDAVNALITLGYNQKAAEKTIRTFLSSDTNTSIEELVKKAISHLGK